ncbi:MAG: asparagine synthase (glutamine-hydrolyzing) [Gammaproteobacteria bacterium]|nr:asparagine synthase (glutamine-hydrolyzing) [Gammaproteobacteria bacterium]
MCGFIGCVDTRGTVDEVRLAELGKRLQHRGPDDAGLWIEGSVGLAHRRLSVIDLSSAGHQPMMSHCGRYRLVYNGEIYNFVELRLQLGEIAWRGNSDTEVLLEALARWGVEVTLSRLVGMFAFALYDQVSHSVTLVRDRLGIKPLYYGFANRRLWFGSELSAFPHDEMRIDRNAVALLLRRNHIPAPYSIYEGVSKLEPGHVLEIDLGRLPELGAPRCYWHPKAFVEERQTTFEEAKEGLRMRLATAVKDRMVADVPLGGFLSGGVDSTLVCALMQDQSDRPVQTYTIGFEEPEFDEAAHARRVAAHIGTQHTELTLSERDVLNVVEKLPTLMDEPFADASLLPTYLVSVLARRSVTVALSGDGGDELTLGYPRYQWAERIARRILPIPRPLRRAVASVCSSPLLTGSIGRLPTPAWLGRPAPLAAKLLRFGDLIVVNDADAVFAQTVSHWRDAHAVVLGSQAVITVYDDANHWSHTLPVPKRWAAKDLVAYLPNDCLTKVDRASMAVSLEARVPLLDHRVVEYCLSLPQSVLCHGGQSKGLLKGLLSDYVPRRLTERPKQGFGVPLGKWLAGPLKDWAEALLDGARLRREGYFDATPIGAMWQQHQQGRGDWSAYLWDVLMFQAWLDDREG